VKLLLDTHAFLWLMGEPSKLSAPARDACGDETNQLLLSVASLWEIQLKHQLGKLRLDVPLDQIVHEQTEAQVIELLPVEAHHVLALTDVPTHHNDPFDRLLVAQAYVEQATLVSVDKALHAYRDHVEILW